MEEDKQQGQEGDSKYTKAARWVIRASNSVRPGNDQNLAVKYEILSTMIEEEVRKYKIFKNDANVALFKQPQLIPVHIRRQIGSPRAPCWETHSFPAWAGVSCSKPRSTRSRTTSRETPKASPASATCLALPSHVMDSRTRAAVLAAFSMPSASACFLKIMDSRD